MAVPDAVDDGHCDCTEKHDVISEHRDESKFEESSEHHDGSKLWKSHHEHRDGSKLWKSHHEHRDGSKFGKVVTMIALGERDSDEGRRSRHERIRAQRVEGSKIGLEQGILKELVMRMLLNQQLEQEDMQEFM